MSGLDGLGLEMLELRGLPGPRRVLLFAGHYLHCSVLRGLTRVLWVPVIQVYRNPGATRTSQSRDLYCGP